MKSLPIGNEEFKNRIVAAARPKAMFWTANLWIVIVPENGLFQPRRDQQAYKPNISCLQTASTVFVYRVSTDGGDEKR